MFKWSDFPGVNATDRRERERKRISQILGADEQLPRAVVARECELVADVFAIGLLLENRLSIRDEFETSRSRSPVDPLVELASVHAEYLRRG